jgi:hypothetical protein
MSFPKNRLCVTLIDFQSSLNVAEQFYLPLEVRMKYLRLLGNSNKRQNIFIRINESPVCVSKYLAPKVSEQFNRFFLLSGINDVKTFEGIDETELESCCKKRKVMKWIKLIEKTEPWSSNPNNKKLLLVCGLVLSNCLSETVFKHQMRLS